MSKHKKPVKNVKIIRRADEPKQGEAVTPPKPELEQPDQLTLQVQNEITAMKNAFYQVTGQTGATFEAVVNNLYQKWFMAYKQNKMLAMEIKRLNEELHPKTKPKPKPEPEPEPEPPK